MTLADYVANSDAYEPQVQRNSITQLLKSNNPDCSLTRGYCDGFGIPHVQTTSFQQKFFKIYDVDYSDDSYSFLFKHIEETLKGIECLKFTYEEEQGRWLCVYGTKPIKKQLSREQLLVYENKKQLLNINNCCFSRKTITLETIYLTNILKLPFNCFMKAGVSENMRSRLRSQIAVEARRMFPNSATGQTPWSEYCEFTEEDHDILRGHREWSEIEVIIRRDISKNKLDIYFNRISGDKVSSLFVKMTLTDSLEVLEPSDFTWNVRSNYIKFVEGCETSVKGNVERYIFNEWLVREISTCYAY